MNDCFGYRLDFSSSHTERSGNSVPCIETEKQMVSENDHFPFTWLETITRLELAERFRNMHYVSLKACFNPLFL
jgi:hypothetical protein